MTAASCKKHCVQNILIWLSGRAVKTQLQIVLIRLFAAMDGYPISVKNELKKFFFIFFYFFTRATDQQYGIRTFEDNSKLHGHTNEHVQLIRRGTSRD